MRFKFLKKDKINRYRYNQLEKKKVIFKYLQSHFITGLNDNSLKKIFFKVFKLGPKGSITVIRSFCFLTGRSRGVLKDYKVSRMEFKKLFRSMKIPAYRNEIKKV